MIYAINKRTKEHRVYEPGVLLSLGERFVQADADGWVEWTGGECPLPGWAPVEVRRRDGFILRRSSSESWDWREMDDSSTIIAYRPIFDDKEQDMSEQGWNGEGEYPPVGSVCMKGHKKVRVLAHANVGSPYDPAVVWQSIDDLGEIDWAVCNVFAPLRTADQRAEDEAVTRIQTEIQAVTGGPISTSAALRIYAAIREGLIPGVNLEC